MKIDIEKIKQRFSEIDEALNEIQKLVSIPSEEFWKEKKEFSSTKILFIIGYRSSRKHLYTYFS
jgi:GH15 family glucan-1,4-alpha-glucosidase